MTKIKIIALFGKSGSGKDTIYNWVTSNYDVAPIVNYTTRPKRDYEIEGKDYNYTDINKFREMILNEEMINTTKFNDWLYGTNIKSLDKEKINIGIFSIDAICQMLEDKNLTILPIFILAKQKTRLLRNLNREENPDCNEIIRRFQSDEKDFKYIDFDYEAYLNEEWDERALRVFFDNQYNDILKYND